MIVAMWETASEDQIQEVTNHLMKMGFAVHRTTGARQSVLAAVGKRIDFDTRELEVLPGVQGVHRISAPYKLVGRTFRPEDTIVKPGQWRRDRRQRSCSDGRALLGGIARADLSLAEKVSKAGAKVLRGGAFKPRSSPYTFQGLGVEALKLLREAGDAYGLMVISEVMEISQIELMMPYIDIFQVGARNMQNFNLLRELGKVRKPVLLKRGIAATIEEMLLSAEYIMSGGNYDVILCERGIRTFETYTRNTHGHLGDSDRAEAVAPADHGRSLARNRIARQGCAHGARVGGGRSGRAADRGASLAGRSAVGRRAVALSRAVRGVDGSAAHDRARSGTDDRAVRTLQRRVQRAVRS